MSHRQLESVRQVLAKILKEKSPISGAQLKVRLIWETTQVGLPPFDERHFGYRKFTDFLAGIAEDLLTIKHPEGPGDVEVFVRQSLNGPETSFQGSKRQSIRLRNAAWQAFTNPDPNRKRFWSKETGEIIHYLEGQNSDFEKKILADPSRFIEIHPTEAATQTNWMLEFLDGADLSAEQKQAIRPIPVQPYSSLVNVLFTRALGQQGELWRSFRVKKVLERAREWAETNGISFEQLKDTPEDPPATQILAVAVAGTPVRKRLGEILDMLEDDEIRRVVLPTALACILVRESAINQ